MNSNPASTGYSAFVRLRLVLGDRTLELASIGPERIRLREPAELPPCDAQVVMNVDDFERRWPVYLPDGIYRIPSGSSKMMGGTVFRRRPEMTCWPQFFQ